MENKNKIYNNLIENCNPIYNWYETYDSIYENTNFYKLPVIYANFLFSHKFIQIKDTFKYVIDGDDKDRIIYGVKSDGRNTISNYINKIEFPLFETLYLNSYKHHSDIFPFNDYQIILSSIDCNHAAIHIIGKGWYVKLYLEDMSYKIYSKGNDDKDFEYIKSNMIKWLGVKEKNVSNFDRISLLWCNICE